jgi:hypothetical protein
MSEIGLGDVIIYYSIGQRYYGVVIQGGNEHFNELTNPTQWIRVRWMGENLPFRNDTDIVNKTTNLVEKYVVEE